MDDQYKKPYLETSVTLAFIKGEKGRLGVVSDILNASESGLFYVYTSTLTITETHKMHGQSALQGKESDKAIDFFEYDFIKLIDVNRRIAEKAHQLCQDYGLTCCDAIHVASALAAKCSVLLTYDSDLYKIQPPGIMIEQPRIINGQIEMDELK